MTKPSVPVEVPQAIKGTKLEVKYLETAKQMIVEQTVLRLFEQGDISSGARLLGMTRHDFMLLLGKRGIPYFTYSQEELEAELQGVRPLRKGGRKRR